MIETLLVLPLFDMRIPIQFAFLFVFLDNSMDGVVVCCVYLLSIFLYLFVFVCSVQGSICYAVFIQTFFSLQFSICRGCVVTFD
jgi:hypothetical protein